MDIMRGRYVHRRYPTSFSEVPHSFPTHASPESEMLAEHLVGVGCKGSRVSDPSRRARTGEWFEKAGFSITSLGKILAEHAAPLGVIGASSKKMPTTHHDLICFARANGCDMCTSLWEWNRARQIWEMGSKKRMEKLRWKTKPAGDTSRQKTMEYETDQWMDRNARPVKLMGKREEREIVALNRHGSRHRIFLSLFLDQ